MTGVLLLAALLHRSPAIPAQEPPDRLGAVNEEAFVERVIVDAYVTAPDGNPIPGLTPEDFRVRVDGKPILLESVDWLPAGTPEVEASPPDGIDSADAAVRWPAEVAPGRLILMFFQTNHQPSRMLGLMRMTMQARRFLDSTLPTDRIAVASYDSHLKLRQDFTSDREKLERAITACLRTGSPPQPDPNSHPALARHLDLAAARKASTPERALALLADALAPIPGGKSMLFFGWGLGTVGGLGGPNPAEVDAWRDAMRGMAAARVNIFSLDVTDADFHSLEGYLEQISDLTGGRYLKTNVFPGLAMQVVGRAISGRYVLVFVKPRLVQGLHTIDVDLVHRKGRVSARQYYTD